MECFQKFRGLNFKTIWSSSEKKKTKQFDPFKKEKKKLISKFGHVNLPSIFLCSNLVFTVQNPELHKICYFTI